MHALDFLTAPVLGTLAGLHTATWGMYKDSIHEGFFWPRYFRSPICGLIMGVIAYVIARPDLSTAAGMVAFFGVTYVLERGAIELWKTFLRNEDQSKYFIPMQFAVFGKVVQDQTRRYIIGAIMTAAVCGTFLVIHYSASKLPLQDSLLALFLVATISGWISARGRSDTTNIFRRSGRSQASLKPTSSSRVNRPIAAASPPGSVA